HAVDQRSIHAAAVADVPRAAFKNDFCMLAREKAILDGNRAVRGAAEGDVFTRNGDLLRRDSRLIDREPHLRPRLVRGCTHGKRGVDYSDPPRLLGVCQGTIRSGPDYTRG